MLSPPDGDRTHLAHENRPYADHGGIIRTLSLLFMCEIDFCFRPLFGDMAYLSKYPIFGVEERAHHVWLMSSPPIC